MAVDEVLLESVWRGVSLPTLRLYAWDPPCLSLGYAQPLSDVDLTRLQAHGWDLVRRPTGGRAILHTDELTYSVVAPPGEERLAGTVLEAYHRLAEALLAALHQLGLPAEIQEGNAAPSGPNANPVCFEVPSTSEITVRGKKLVGSAQARRKEGVLQHGSLPLTGDLSRIVDVLAYPEEDARRRAGARLLERAATAESILGHPVSWEQAGLAFQSAFQAVLGLEFKAEGLSASELARAAELGQVKYSHPDWRGEAIR
jgi:lipoate-protein ligase A